MAGDEESRDSAPLRPPPPIHEDDDRNRGQRLLVKAAQQPQPHIQIQQQSIMESLPPKSQLTAYVGRAHLQPPVYHTVNEDLLDSTPKFKCTVLVDGVAYESPNTFCTMKAAEQDAAKYALEGIAVRLREEGRCFVREDKHFCKSILIEFAMKMYQKLPVYTTKKSEGNLPFFTASVVFNGVEYTGEAGRNKKEAEQLAARTTILSILDGSEMVLSEVIKCKAKLKALMQQSKDALPVSNLINEIGRSGTVENEIKGSNGAHKPPGNATMKVTSRVVSNHSVMDMYTAELISGNGEPAFHAIGLPVVSIPATQVQPSENGLRSLKKRICKNKKNSNKRKSNKRARIDAQTAINQDPPSTVPQSQDPPCALRPLNQDSRCPMCC